jgi:hypothetical protein
MAIYVEQIANAAVAKIINLPPTPVPTPDLIDFRKTDVLHPGEAPAVIVTIGGELPIEGDGGFALQGAGDPNEPDGYGYVGKRYLIGVSIYTESHGNISTGTDEHTNLVLKIKQAFDVPTLDGADSWWACKLHQHPEWEHQFANGAEISRFVIEAFSAEPRNGQTG